MFPLLPHVSFTACLLYRRSLLPHVSSLFYRMFPLLFYRMFPLLCLPHASSVYRMFPVTECYRMYPVTACSQLPHVTACFLCLPHVLSLPHVSSVYRTVLLFTHRFHKFYNFPHRFHKFYVKRYKTVQNGAKKRRKTSEKTA